MADTRVIGMSAALVLVLVVAAALPVLAAPPRTAAVSLVEHAPISIIGNADFTAANGVTGGSGTASDPFVIAGWSIDAPPSIGVQIRNTDAYAMVRDVVVTVAAVAGFYAFDVSNLTFSNVTAFGSAGDGLRIESSHDVVVERSNATANSHGIVLTNSANASVVANHVTLNHADGVVVSQSTAVRVEANVIAHGGLYGGYGLDLASSTNVKVLRNRFTGNDVYLDGTVAAHFTSQTITPDNLVGGLPILYVTERTGLTLSGLELGELLLAGCVHTTVSNLTTAGGDLGVEVGFSSDVLLGPNLTISDAALGLRIASSSSVRFVNGSILDTGTGASIESSTDVALGGSKVSAPFATTRLGDGVTIVGSNRVNLSGNILRRHLTGISAYSSGNVSLVRNVASLDALAVRLDGSRDLVVVDNLWVQDGSGLDAAQLTNATFAGNAFEGAFLGANVSGSSGLRFFHNAFVGDTVSAHDTNGTADAWDAGYPTGGNFWSNYTGVDHCSGAAQTTCTGPDGFGDTPYRFAVNATDRYPRMLRPALADVPPEALFYVLPSAGSVIATFAASANLSSDYEDPLVALQVRWDWTGNGSWTPWTAAKFASHTYGFPGTYALKLEVRDTANLTDAWTTKVLVVPKPDNLPPAIAATVPPSVDVGQAISVVANITDASGVANATLLYRGVDGGPFQSVPMFIQNGGTNFTATIPAQTHAGTIEYVIVANDTWANEARAPLSGDSVIVVADPGATLLLYVVLPVVVGMAMALTVFFLWRRRKNRVPPTKQTPPGPPPS